MKLMSFKRWKKWVYSIGPSPNQGKQGFRGKKLKKKKNKMMFKLKSINKS